MQIDSGTIAAFLPRPVPAEQQARSPAKGEIDERQPAQQRTGPQSAAELSPEEQSELRDLQQRDRAVRAHEQAHVVAGGRYVTRPPSYDYENGPDGRQYAVGGEVSIDTGKPSDPEKALEKARTIHRAALAPVDPSPQDYRVAAEARAMESEARRELREERQEEAGEAQGAAVRQDSDEPDNNPQQQLQARITSLTTPASGPSLQLIA